MEACLKQAPIVEKQLVIKEVACIPSSNRNWINFNDFLKMMDAISERREIWGEPYLNQHGNWEPLLTDPKNE